MFTQSQGENLLDTSCILTKALGCDLNQGQPQCAIFQNIALNELCLISIPDFLSV